MKGARRDFMSFSGRIDAAWFVLNTCFGVLEWGWVGAFRAFGKFGDLGWGTGSVRGLPPRPACGETCRRPPHPPHKSDCLLLQEF
jgi:hypothetical protein